MYVRTVDMDRLQALIRLHRLGSGGARPRVCSNAEREYRRARAAEGLFDGSVD